MAFYTGSSGDLLIDGQKAGKIRSWSVSASATTLDTTTLSDTDRTAIYGIRSATGSCSLFYYTTDPTTKADNSASVLLNKIIKARAGADPGQAADAEKVMLRLRVNDGTTNGKYIEGEALLTSASMTMAVGEVLAADVSFEFNGAPTGVNI